jgi:multisubunit Na+/H+ antiporter MnhE subunit
MFFAAVVATILSLYMIWNIVTMEVTVPSLSLASVEEVSPSFIRYSIEHQNDELARRISVIMEESRAS